MQLVVANPPYVAGADPLPAEVLDWEPAGAIVAGDSGLEAIERIVSEAPVWLQPGGALVVEIGETQGPAVTALAHDAGFEDVTVHHDLAAKDRVLKAR